MSQENVERLHRGYDAFNRRDLDAFLALMDPEVELMTRFMELEGDPYYRGHDGVREWWRALLAVFPDFNSEVLNVRDLGDCLMSPCAFAVMALKAVRPLSKRCGRQSSCVTAGRLGGGTSEARPKP